MHLNDDEFVREISIRKAEREFYSFQTVCAAMRDSFPEQYDALMAGFLEMVAFDSLVGNNDRHPLNWGVIVPVKRRLMPRFAPVFDTARALFWNVSETRVARMLGDMQALNAYVERSIPQIGWDGHEIRSHFDLSRLVCDRHPEYRAMYAKFLDEGLVLRVAVMIEDEFRFLMTPARRKLIVKCLRLRQHRLAEVVG